MYYDMLKSRRSTRKFTDTAVEKEKIDTMLKCALTSPSSKSSKSWEFIAVTDKAVLAALSECRGHSSQFLAGAPLGMVVIADPELSNVWVEDASIASTIIQLAAQSLGLGSCWIQVRQRAHDEQTSAEAYVKKVLGIPEKYHVENLIAIGYPNENKNPHDEEKLRYDKIHIDKF